MKKLIYGAVAIALITGLYAFRTLNRTFSDIFKQLGIENNEANDYIFGNFRDGGLYFPKTDVMMKLAVGKRAEAVKEIGDYIKKYVQSPQFAGQYKAMREEQKPAGGPDSEEKIKDRIEQVKHDIEEGEERLKTEKNPDMKKLIQFQLEQLRQELKALTNPGDPKHAYYVKEATEDKWGQFSAANFEEDMKYWKEAYPEKVPDMVRKRLQEFLKLTANMDFNAKLVKSPYSNKLLFADPELEAKSSEWKYCFRSGKETITAARAYAQQWLNELK